MAGCTMHFSCSSFPRYADFLAHVRKQTDEAELGTHIIYEDVEEGWARQVWTTLEEGYKRRNIRKSLNTLARTLSLKVMPTEIHDCHQAWQRQTERDWVRSGLLTLDEADGVCIRVGTTLEFRSGPYRSSRKEPDMFLRPDGAELPTLAIEAGWSESSASLQDDMNLLLAGAAGAMRTVFILKWRKHNDDIHVSGTIEVYGLDANGMRVRRGPVLTIFPTPQNDQADVIRITRRELFWNVRLAPNENPGDIFEYRVDVLRTVARKSLTRMGLLPA